MSSAKSVSARDESDRRGTALGIAVWSALNKPRPADFEIIETLLAAGAQSDEVSHPTGDQGIDGLLMKDRTKRTRPS